MMMRIAAALVAAVVATGAARADSTTMLPAPQWIANCIRNFESPEGRKPFELLGQKPPTHEQNVSYCTEQYRIFAKERLRQ
jgi:hypothetical protein